MQEFATVKPMTSREVHTLDLHFQGFPQTIAAFVVPYATGAVLIETGPGSTVPRLQSELARVGLKPQDISDVLVTHIHLDHAGAAGWMAQHGANVHVHLLGAPHLIDPARLLASATRIYGDDMDRLWGDFLPVPGDQLFVVRDGDTINIGELRFEVLQTQGHASHHHAYLLDDICFCGDVGGVRIPGPMFIRLPTPPPEFMPDLWLKSISRIRAVHPKRVALTHFGVYDDSQVHLNLLETVFAEFNLWIANSTSDNPDQQTLQIRNQQRERDRLEGLGLTAAQIELYETVNSSVASADGVYRYWKKYLKG